MTLGSYRFGVASAAYQQLERSTEYTWVEQEVAGRLSVLQYTGPGRDQITLPGVVMPHYRGGLGQLDTMRELAGGGRPLLLTDGLGRVWGQFVILSVDEVQSRFLRGGVPRRQQFTLTLRRYA